MGRDVYIGCRQYCYHTVVCLLQLCAAVAEEVMELLRVVFTAYRPQTASFATGKDDAVVICLISHIYVV